MIYTVWRDGELICGPLPGHDAAQLFSDIWHNEDPNDETALAIVPDGYELHRKAP